jgi:DNA-binding response OmpR family regulator
MPTPLSGCRVLVVEDEVLIAMLLEAALEDAGCVVVGPYSNVTDAAAAAARETLRAALLDVNLGGEKVFPVAELLQDRGVPFLLLSGYGDRATPPEHADWPTHGKPFNTEELLGALGRLVVSAV